MVGEEYHRIRRPAKRLVAESERKHAEEKKAYEKPLLAAN